MSESSHVLLEPNLALVDISCRQFHNEKRHCAQEHLFFQLHPDHFVGCSLSLAFHEWVNDCSWCCRPLVFPVHFCLCCSISLCRQWSPPGAKCRDHPAGEQELTALPKATSCIQRAKAIVLWVSSCLWLWKHARAVGMLWGAMPGQGSPVWCSSQQRMCTDVVCPVLCLIFLQENSLVYTVRSLDDTYCVFLWISGEPGPCCKRIDDQQKSGSAIILYFSANTILFSFFS